MKSGARQQERVKISSLFFASRRVASRPLPPARLPSASKQTQKISKRLTSPLFPLPLPGLLTNSAPKHRPSSISRRSHRPTHRRTHHLPCRLPVSRNELFLLACRDCSGMSGVELDGCVGGGEEGDVGEETTREEEDGEFCAGVEVRGT